MNPVDLSKLLNFDDLTPLDKAIEKIEKLSAAYDVLVNSAAANAAKYTSAIDEITASAGKLEKEITNLDAAEQDHQKTIAEGAAQADKLLKENDAYKIGLKELEKQIIALKEQQDKLASAKDKLKDKTKGEINSITALKEELSKTIKEYEKFGDATDASVKDAHIKKIEELSKAVVEADKALKDARKAVDYAAGSYYELNQRVVAAKKRLKEMEGGLKGNSKEFQDLKKFVKEGGDQLKNFDKAVGDNQRNVGNYESAFGALDNRLGGVIGQTKQLGKEFIALASNPVVLTLGIIIGLLYAAGNAMKTFYTETGEGEDVLAEQSAIWDAFFLQLRKGWQSVGKALSDTFDPDTTQGIIAGFLAQYSGLAAAFNAAANAGRELAKEIQRLDSIIIRNTITKAERQLEANKLLEDSANKLKFTDEQRLIFLKDAGEIQGRISTKEIMIAKDKLKIMQADLLLKRKNVDFLKYEIDFEAWSLGLLEQEIVESGLLGEEKQKLADAVAHVIDLEAQYFQQQKSNTKAVTALTLEIERAKRESARRAVDTQISLDKYILNASVEMNKEVLANENTSLEQRLAAIEQMRLDREAILKLEKQNELNAVQRAAEDRILAEGKRVTDALLAGDKALYNQRAEIVKKYSDLIKQVNKDNEDAIDKALLDSLLRDFNSIQSTVRTSVNGVVTELERMYREGLIPVERLEKERAEAIAEGNRGVLLEQLDYLEAQLKLYENDTYKRIELEEKIAQVRKELSNSTTDEMIANEKRYKQAVESIGFQIVDTAQGFLNADVERNVQRLEQKLSDEERASESALRIVGDDAQAKAFIEEELARKQDEINKQIAAQKRKAAIFDRAVTVAQIGYNTAKGISAAVAASPLTFGLPWSAFVGITGALQLANVLAQPLPAFFMGTDYSPEGLALVGEKGRELIISPSGEARIATGPQLTYLERGSQVKHNAATEAILKDAEAYGDGYLMDQTLSSYDRNTEVLARAIPAYETAKIVGALDGHTKQIVQAIKTQPQDFWDEKGYRHYENTVNARILSLNKRYKLQ